MSLIVHYKGRSASPFRLTIPEQLLAFDRCTALIGRSGAGKSTLVKTLAGPWHKLVVASDAAAAPTPPPSARSWIARLFSQDDARKEEFVRAQLSISGEILAVHQDPADCLLLRKSLFAHKRLISDLVGPDQALDFEEQVEALGIGFREYRDSPPEALSGGQQRRLALALSLSFRPSLLIIDEALGALDFVTAQRAMEHVMSLTESRGLRILLVSHDLYTLSVHSSSAIVVRDGVAKTIQRTGVPDGEWLSRLRGEFE